MPDYPTARTMAGSVVSVEVLPRGPERLTRTLDHLASFGSGTAEGLRLLVGRRGWIVRCEIDLTDGSAPRVDRTWVTRQQRAEEIAAAILHRAITGDEADDLLHYIRDVDEAST